MISRLRTALCSVIVALGAISGSAAHAATNTFFFKGTNPALSRNTPSDYGLTELPATVIGSLTYDTDATPLQSVNPSSPVIDARYPALSLQFAFAGGSTLGDSALNPVIWLINRQAIGSDIYYFNVNNFGPNELISPTTRVATAIVRGQADYTVGTGFEPEDIEQIALPGWDTDAVFSLLRLADGSQAFLTYNTIEFSNTSFAAPVPLPASLPLMIAGIAGLGVYARRRHS